MTAESFGVFFERIAGCTAHDWQAELGQIREPTSRLIRVPTGFGKTLGVLLAWAYHRVHRDDEAWPRRLVWCLPMRALVEQTYAEALRVVSLVAPIWNGSGARSGKTGVHLLMGGVDTDEWHLWPEESAVLIGTQDMLLSRALNRGYAAARARWPMEFGLLNHDCLWVMDEVQLMDVGLATSAQLQAFRGSWAASPRPTLTWWMSATLQRGWLETRDTRPWMANIPKTSVERDARRGPLWEDVTKSIEIDAEAAEPKQLARCVLEAHADAGLGAQGPTLVVVNTVDRAIDVANALRARRPRGSATDVRIVHSRFRPAERRGWRESFLRREACGSGTDRIIVSTQVVEAGVDVSARVLVTDLAPWPSLVQRFGRAARWGGSARVIVIDTAPEDDDDARPYSKDELDAARDALGRLSDVAPAALEAFEDSLSAEEITRLYPYEPSQLVLRHEVAELFDTTPDLSGADVDVSRFIRSGEERDLHVFWAPVPIRGLPAADTRPSRDALCPVPFLRAREWLCGNDQKRRTLAKRRSAWVWSWTDGQWREAERGDLYPGQTVLVDANHGGYDWDPATQWGTGWSPKYGDPVTPIDPARTPAGELADSTEDGEPLCEIRHYRTIATHGAETGELAEGIASRVAPQHARLLRLAAEWHDVGKAHPVFQGSIRAEGRPQRDDLAKAPEAAWPRKHLYEPFEGKRRPGFRHELASALALFGLVRRRQPMHGALLGPWAEMLEHLGEPVPDSEPLDAPPSRIEQEILALAPIEFDLLAYLVASHHGKVRVGLHASAADQRTMAATGRVTIRGVQSDDELPALAVGANGEMIPALRLDIAPASMGLSPRTGASWSDRVLRLVEALGPFELAWLEALLRASDQRASRIDTPDPRLELG